MQSHIVAGQTVKDIPVKLCPGGDSGPFVVLAFGHAEVHAESLADCDMGIRAFVEAKRLLSPPPAVTSPVPVRAEQVMPGGYTLPAGEVTGRDGEDEPLRCAAYSGEERCLEGQDHPGPHEGVTGRRWVFAGQLDEEGAWNAAGIDL